MQEFEINSIIKIEEDDNVLDAFDYFHKRGYKWRSGRSLDDMDHNKKYLDTCHVLIDDDKHIGVHRCEFELSDTYKHSKVYKLKYLLARESIINLKDTL